MVSGELPQLPSIRSQNPTNVSLVRLSRVEHKNTHKQFTSVHKKRLSTICTEYGACQGDRQPTLKYDGVLLEAKKSSPKGKTKNVAQSGRQCGSKFILGTEQRIGNQGTERLVLQQTLSRIFSDAKDPVAFVSRHLRADASTKSLLRGSPYGRSRLGYFFR